MSDGRIVGALTACPLFYGRPIHAMVTTCALKHYPAGAVLFRAGEPAGHLVVLRSGRVDTFRLRPDGSEHPLAEHRAPVALGEVGIFTAARRWDRTARAVTDVDAVLVPRDGVRQAAVDDPVLAERVVTLLADAAAAHPGWSTGSGEAAERVLACLTTLAATCGRAEPDGSIRIALPLTQAELGRLVAADRPAVARALKDLVAAGTLARRDDRWVLVAERT